jgi:hypothetical protein
VSELLKHLHYPGEGEGYHTLRQNKKDAGLTPRLAGFVSLPCFYLQGKRTSCARGVRGFHKKEAKGKRLFVHDKSDDSTIGQECQSPPSFA